MDQSLDMASHHRVVQIRAESGIPPLPPAPQPEFESEEVRNARFNELQRVSITSCNLFSLLVVMVALLKISKGEPGFEKTGSHLEGRLSREPPAAGELGSTRGGAP